MTLWFQNSQGKKRIISDCASWDEVMQTIDEFIQNANTNWPNKKPFKSYYTRTWTENNATIIDVGSWSEFFIWDNKE